MQRNQSEPFPGAHSVQGCDCGVDLCHPRHEDENIPSLTLANDAFHGIGGLFGNRTLIMMREIFHLNGEALAFGNEDGAGDGDFRILIFDL